MSGVMSSPLAKLRFGMNRTAYQAAAEAAITSESSRTPEGRFAIYALPSKWRSLSPGGGVWYYKMNGRDYVYFCLEDEVTLSAGLYYSPTGSTSPEPAGSPIWHNGKWYFAGMGNGYIESHLATSTYEYLTRQRGQSNKRIEPTGVR
jgi:hypothetical protein